MVMGPGGGLPSMESMLKTVFYKFDVEISNNPKFLPTYSSCAVEKSRQEFCKFLG